MFDHVSIKTNNYSRSRDWYKTTLASLEYKVLYEEENILCGFGSDRPQFWVALADDEYPETHSVHISFEAPDRKIVDNFYKTALEAGGKDNGASGIRNEYAENYYGAFVLDPDGNNIEAVTFNE